MGFEEFEGKAHERREHERHEHVTHRIAQSIHPHSQENEVREQVQHAKSGHTTSSHGLVNNILSGQKPKPRF